jgi:cytochrome c
MKSLIVGIVATAGLMIAGTTLAADMPAVAKSKCNACHALDKKMVGPSYRDISAKYKGDPDAVSKIAASATRGGAFGWKMSQMPPRGMGASDAEIMTMAKFIAGLSK